MTTCESQYFLYEFNKDVKTHSSVSVRDNLRQRSCRNFRAPTVAAKCTMMDTLFSSSNGMIFSRIFCQVRQEKNIRETRQCEWSADNASLRKCVRAACLWLGRVSFDAIFE